MYDGVLHNVRPLTRLEDAVARHVDVLVLLFVDRGKLATT